MSTKTKQLARNAMLLTIMMVFLYLRTLIPVYQLAFYFLASLIPGIVIMENGLKQSIIFVIASIILSLMLPIDKISFLLFYSFFGLYGVVKYIIEKIPYRIIIMVVKLLYFSGIFLLNMYFGGKIINVLPQIMLENNIWYVYAVAIVVFVLYDITYTSFSVFYIKKIKRYTND